MRDRIVRILLQGLGMLLLIAATVFVLLRWRALPESIPSHFDAAGLPDAYGDKNSLISLLVVGWVAYLLFTVLSYFPQTWNLPVKTPRAYRIAGLMMPVLGLVLAFVFSWILTCTVLGRGLGAWFLPAVGAGIGIPVLVLIVGGARS